MGGERSVLVLGELTDDERSSIERDCESSGFDLTWVTSAETASAKLASGEFDTLLIHLLTPGAARVCLNARSKLAHGRFPILALSEEANDLAFTRAFRAGADDLVRVGANAQVSHRLDAVPRPSQIPAESTKGEALVIDPDRGRSDVMERVLADAGYRVESVRDELAAKLHLGRPSIRLVVADAGFGDASSMVEASSRKGSRAVWVVRTRPDQIPELGRRLAKLKNASVVSAYGPPDDVLFEANRLMSESSQDSRTDPRLLHGTTVVFRDRTESWEEYGFAYNVSANGLFVRTLALPESDELEVELCPPGRDSTVRLTGNVVWRRVFGPAQSQSTPPGFGLQFSGGELTQWAEAFREAYAEFYGNNMPEETVAEKRLRKPARSGIPMPRTAAKLAPAAAIPAPGGLRSPKPAPAPVPAAPRTKPRVRQPSTAGRDTLSSVEDMLSDVLGPASTRTTGPATQKPGSKPLTIKNSLEVAEEEPESLDKNEPSGTPAGPPAQLSTHRKPAAAAAVRRAPAAKLVDVTVPDRAPPGAAGKPPAAGSSPAAKTSGGKVSTGKPPSSRRKAFGAPRPKMGTIAGIAPASEDPAAQRAAGLSRPPFGAPRTESGRPEAIEPEELGDIELASEPPPAQRKPPPPRPSANPEEATELDSIELASVPPGPVEEESAAPPRTDGLEFALDAPAKLDLATAAAEEKPELAHEPAAAAPAEEKPADPRPPDRKEAAAPDEAPGSPNAAPIKQEPPADGPQDFGTRTQTFGAFLAHARASSEALSGSPQPPGHVRITDPPASGEEVHGLDLLPSDPPPSKNTTEVSRADLLPDELHDLVFNRGKPASDPHAGGDSEGAGPGAPEAEGPAAPDPAAPVDAAIYGSANTVDETDQAIIESVIPKKRSAGGVVLMVLGVSAAIGAGAFFALRPSPSGSNGPAAKGGTPSPTPVATAAATANPAAPTEPEEPTPATSASAEATTAAPAPSASTAATSVPAEEAAGETAEAAGETPASSPGSPPAPDKPATALDPEYGYLYVESSLDTNVFVHGKMMGKTNEVITTHCGTRFIRLGTDPGHWQSDGIPQRLYCQKMNRVKIK